MHRKSTSFYLVKNRILRNMYVLLYFIIHVEVGLFHTLCLPNVVH